ncbi:MAG TPA: LytTR family DNA-binding domain-containing protein [Membranihabitans sp.]|nr:LytTR family DNA-binding domain-containing protein [Membranihabitans sp.]
MRTFKSLIVEDNRKASDLLKNKLTKYCPAVGVIDQTSQLDEAMTLLEQNQYQLLFLDIGLPIGSGFDLIEYIENHENITMPAIIFTTGQSQKEYLLKAIRVSAADYLYKPISNDELIQAVHKATTRIQQEKKINDNLNLIAQLSGQKSPAFDQIPILMIKGVIEYVDSDKIKYLEANGSMTTIKLTEGKDLQSVRHLGYYKDQLRDHPSFFLISSAAVVNLSLISRYDHSRLLLTFKDGETLHASKRGGKELKDFLRS